MTAAATAKSASKADLKAAAELDAMADALDPGFSAEQLRALSDFSCGAACAERDAAHALRQRAAALRAGTS